MVRTTAPSSRARACPCRRHRTRWKSEPPVAASGPARLQALRRRRTVPAASVSESSPRSLLLLFAHPAYEWSRVNRTLVDAIEGMEGVTFLDVADEQRLLEAHDVVVFQHPLHWYSMPPLLKLWTDLVFEHGWAYGADGNALRGKLCLHAMTAGGPQSAYTQGGSNRHPLRVLTRHFEQTARLCGMDYLAPFVVHGTHRMSAEERADHAAAFRRTLEALRDGELDLERAREVERINGLVQ